MRTLLGGSQRGLLVLSDLRLEQLRVSVMRDLPTSLVTIVPTITLMYSCTACRLNRVEVRIPARINEDVVWWMKNVVTKRLDADHSDRSPYCPAESLSAVLIPISGADRLGG